ncbi:MAG: NAD+ synthase [Proteobacteria bacterium]|nr:NAD+ synthase [Pseudomonadota bacterium]
MTDSLKIALAQINPTVGDIEGNLALIRRRRAEAAALGAELVVTTELSVTGYPPEDLVLKPAFLECARAAVAALAEDTGDGGPGLIVGAPWLEAGEVSGPLRRHVTNAVLLLDGGRIKGRRDKRALPNYGVFDEVRVFKAGPPPGPVDFRGVRLGLPVCEDLWTPEVPECLVESGAEILIVPNGSPYERDKADTRIQTGVARVTETGLPLIYVNQVGGQDELVFDGGSFVLDAGCRLRAQLPMFREALVVTEWRRGGEGGGKGDGKGVWTCADSHLEPPEVGMEPVYGALTLGLRDYVDKNRFSGVILGLSGGIDSALTAAVATDALGADRVHCVMMPSPYTSQDSLEDAAETARLLGVRLDEVGIEPAMDAFEGMLEPIFDALAPDTTEENIQARARMVTLMAISNKLGFMLLSTGNKSEVSVGYTTLYGDMAGGFNVLKDVYKTAAYGLARWRNQALPRGALGPAGRVIPERVLTKAPSAELKPDQTDQDTLPPYEVLDEILECLIEAEMGVDEIAARGHDRDTVNRVWRMLETSEYKRRQACPGVKITRRAFGRDRRYPITNAFKGPA